MPKKHPIWQLFYEDGSKYKTDHTHKNAWCLGCLLWKIRHPDSSGLADPGQQVHVPTFSKSTGLLELKEADWTPEKESGLFFANVEALASAIIEPICGKAQANLIPHARKCNKFTLDTFGSDLRDRTLAAIDAGNEKENIPPSPGLPVSCTSTPLRLRTVSAPFLSRSNSESSELTEMRPHKRQKTLGVDRSIPSGDPEQDQAEFASDCLQLFCDNKMAFNIADSPTTKAFFEKWLPYLKFPTRKLLSGRLLDEEVQLITNDAHEETQAKLATGQCDGWKNVAKTNVVTSMMTVNQKEYPIRTHNMFGEPKTGDRLFELIMAEIEYMKEVFGVETICWCSDNGPDGKKARRLLHEQCAWIIVLVCWAHQINLMVGDILKARSSILHVISKALDIIRYFNDHGKALSLLRDEQKAAYEGKYWALFNPPTTRWLGTYVSIERLLKVEKAMRICRVKWEETLISQAGRDLQDKTRTTLSAIGDDQFWKDLESVRRILEPLSIANNVTQAPNLRLDHVLITLGNLYRIYKSSADLDLEIRAKILNSLEKRWKAADQDVFILSVFFNPYVRGDLFSSAVLSHANLYEIAERVYKRLMRSEPPDALAFFRDFDAYYLRKQGTDFSPERMNLAIIKQMYESAGEPIDVLSIWHRMAKPGDPTQALVNLATRLLSAVANSTACERIFSDFGSTHTKSRNKLDVERVHKMTTVRKHIRQKMKEAGLTEKRLKRRLGEVTASETHGLENNISSCAGLGGTNIDIPEQETFEETAQTLIADAIEDDAVQQEDDDTEDVDLPANPLANPYQTRPIPNSQMSGSQRQRPQGKIPLASLFNYPAEVISSTQGPNSTNPQAAAASNSVATSTGGLDMFWKGGLINLSELVDSYDRTSDSQ